ncbi:MAG: HD domain-containing protein [Candidatus Omnitrophica bacterium]|nr:HD domain-containing protein [Candidatus Omnitrophota bacterium]
MRRGRRAAPRPRPACDPAAAALDLLGEAGMLKLVRRSGWWMIGIKNGESVAEHSFRAALLGYILARMERVDPYPVVMMGLINDLHEARINDLHKVGHRYIDFPAAERKASAEQLACLPAHIGAELIRWSRDLSGQATRASLIARDADILECMIQGKEYADRGHARAIDWMKRPAHLLRTKSAKALARRLRAWQSDSWWQHLVTLAR